MADQAQSIGRLLLTRVGWLRNQLVQASMQQRLYPPRLLASNDRSAFCDLHWLEALQYLEDHSATLAQRLAAAEGAGTLPVVTNADPWLLSTRKFLFQRRALRLQNMSE